jgi:hypothetical protein
MTEEQDFEEPQEEPNVEPQDEWPWNVTVTPPPEFGEVATGAE